MSAFESELENLLGEFHIKMKGEPGRSAHVAQPAAALAARQSLCFSPFTPLLLAAALKWEARFFFSSSHDLVLNSNPLFFSLVSGRFGRFRPAVSRRPVRGRSPFSAIPKTQSKFNRSGSSTEESLVWRGSINHSTLVLFQELSFQRLKADSIFFLSYRSSCVMAASAGS